MNDLDTVTRIRTRINKDDDVVCIVPTLNESSTVTEVVVMAKQFAHRVIVIDGHSQDDTVKKAWEAGAEIINQDGKGKGMALRTVFDNIKGGVYVTIDGDATYNPQEIGKLTQPILNGDVDVVIGSRLKGTMEAGSISKTNILGNRFFNFLINLLYNGKITDSQSGFRAMSRKAIESMNLSSEGFEIETEMTIKALIQGLRIREIPITYVRRRGSPSKLNSFKDGSRILKMIIRPSKQNLKH